MTRGSRRIAFLLTVALLAAMVPVAAPAAAAEVSVAAMPTGDLRAVSFLSATTGFAVSSTGGIFKTTDGGSDWTQVHTAGGYDYRGIDFWDATHGVAVDYTGKVSSTSNGSTWTNVDFTPDTDMDRELEWPPLTHLDVACAPGYSDFARAIAAAGDTNITDENWVGPSVMRTEGLLNWWWPNQRFEDAPYYWLPPYGDGRWVGEGEIRDVDFASSTAVWAVGIDTYPTQKTSVVLQSTDAGSNWAKASLGTAINTQLNGVSFGSASAGVTVGQSLDSATLNQGRAYYTTNSGTNWSAGTLPGTTALNAVYMSTASNGWAVGANGSIIRTTNGGQTWTACTITGGNAAQLYDVEFIDGTTTGWAVGASGTVLKTTDGATWAVPAAADTTPPTLSAVSSSSHPVEATWYPSRAISTSWSASDASGVAGYAVVLDQSATTVPATTITQAGTTFATTLAADGVWYVHVRAVDSLGNWSATQHRALRADTAPPSTTSNAVASYSGSALIALTPSDPAPASGVAATYWSVGGTSGTGTSVSVTTEGDFTLGFASTDNAGNRETTKTADFSVEIAPGSPAVSSSSHPVSDEWYGTRDFAASWTADADVTGYAVVVNQSASTDPGTSVTQSASTYGTTVASDGVWYLHVRAVDGRGNWGAPTHFRFQVDSAVPALDPITSSSHPVASTWYPSRSALTAWSASDPQGIAGYAVVLDQSATTVPAAAITQAGTTFATTLAADGVWYVHVRAVDAVGNWSGTQHRALRADTAPPSTTSNATASYVGSASITLTPSDPAPASGIAATYWSLDGGTSGTGTSVVVTAPGTWTLRFASADNAGNRETTKTASFVVQPAAVTVVPVAGTSRISTAIEASKKAYPGTATTVVLATAYNWPDALGGAALAGAVDGPILLTYPTSLPAEVAAEMDRLGATKAIILGGTSAVTTAVESALRTKLGTSNVQRVAGGSRYDTARKIAEETVRVVELSGTYDGTAFVATGMNFPDALGASPLAAAKGWPIYLIDPRGLDAATVASMQGVGVTKAIVLGGTGAVPAPVASAVGAQVGCTVERVNGVSRYETAVAVATYGVANAGLGWDGVALATGTNFPDALAGGALQGKTGSVLLLTPSTTLDASPRSALAAHKAAISEIRFLGGLGALSEAVRTAALAALD